MMADDTIDLLKIKIEQAKAKLPVETVNAIATIDWRAAILGLRTRYGYTFEQLGDLEIETELLLCGLVSPEDYPKELEKRMRISKAQANELVNEINDLVFKKIREELVKNTERKKIFATSTTEEKNDTKILNSAGIEIISARPSEWSGAGEEEKETLPIPDLPAVPSAQLMQAGKLELTEIPAHTGEEKPKEAAHPILAQKLSGYVKNEVVETEHSLDNITKTNMPNPVNGQTKISKVDPYREIPE